MPLKARKKFRDKRLLTRQNKALEALCKDLEHQRDDLESKLEKQEKHVLDLKAEIRNLKARNAA